MSTSKLFHYFGLGVAGLAGSTLIGQLMQYDATRTGAIALWMVLLLFSVLFAGGIFLALKKNQNVTGGQYFNLLQWPIGAIALLMSGLVLGIQAG